MKWEQWVEPYRPGGFIDGILRVAGRYGFKRVVHLALGTGTGAPYCTENGFRGLRRSEGRTGEGVEPLTMLLGGNEAGCLERGRVAVGQYPKVNGASHLGEWGQSRGS